MATLSEIYIKKDVLETLLKVLNSKNEQGVSITISQSDKSNDYGSNVYAYVSQTKEQREAKKDQFKVGYGKVFWSKGETPIGKKPDQVDQSVAQPEPSGGLPF